MLRHKNKGTGFWGSDIVWKMYKDFLKTIYGREKFRYNR